MNWKSWSFGTEYACDSVDIDKSKNIKKDQNRLSWKRILHIQEYKLQSSTLLGCCHRKFIELHVSLDACDNFMLLEWFLDAKVGVWPETDAGVCSVACSNLWR